MQLATFGQFTPALQRRLNTWYSANDGNWSDPNTWISNAVDKKNVVSPRTGDNVYILHKVNFDISATVNNLTIQGKLSSNVNGLTLTVNGWLQSIGTIDFTSNNTNVLLYGYENYVLGTFTSGNSTITYTRAGDQNIMNLSYKNVVVHGIGKKYLTSNLTITGNLNVNDFQADTAFLECGTFDLTVNGTTSVTAPNGVANGNMGKSGAGNIIFKGAFNSNSNIVWSSSITNIEFQNGGAILGFSGNIVFNCPVTFTTNNQSLTGSTNGTFFNNTVTILGAITVTNTMGASGVSFNGIVTGNNVSSTLNNNGIMSLGTTTVPMSTGIFNYQNLTTSTLSYNFNGNYTLPYTSYANLIILGTGTKTLSGNTSCNNLSISLFLGGDSKLDCLTNNLTVNGTTIMQDNNAGILSSGTGTLLFIGAVTFNTSNFNYASNVTLEFRGGGSLQAFSAAFTCAATLNFTTNNQNITVNQSNTWSGAFNIANGITVNLTCGLTLLANATQFTGVLNGLGSTAICNIASGFFNYQNATAPMTTGKLYCNQTTNTFVYGASGNQDITTPSDPTTPGYKNLTLNGSGAKRLLGNVSVKGTYTLTSPATLNSNGFALTNP